MRILSQPSGEAEECVGSCLLPLSLPNDFQEMHKPASARRSLKAGSASLGQKGTSLFQGVGWLWGCKGEWSEVTPSNQIYSYFLSPLLLPLNCLVC